MRPEMPTRESFTPEHQTAWWELMGKIPKAVELQRQHTLWLELIVRNLVEWRKNGDKRQARFVAAELKSIGLTLKDFSQKK
jgi:hypothetical protein